MKVELLVARADATGAQNRGDVVDVTKEEAERLFEAGIARPVRKRAAETAVPKGKPERAAE